MQNQDNKKRGQSSMTQGFIAQYAAEASLNVNGVAALEKSAVASFKEAFGVEHEGAGVEVIFSPDKQELVEITVYPILYFGFNIPEIAWEIQSNVKTDVEKFTGLEVNAVNVFVKDVIRQEGDMHG